MWKFHDFSITQILREINVEDSRIAKSEILTHLEALNFDFCAFLHLPKTEIHQNQNSETLNVLNDTFSNSRILNIDFT